MVSIVAISNISIQYCLPKMKWFQVLLFDANYSIHSFICSQLNGSKYCYLMLIILFIHLFTVKWFQVLLFDANYSIHSFVYS